MTKREDQAREYAAEQWKYVRIYGAKGDSLGLTPEEREAITQAIEALEEDASIISVFSEELSNKDLGHVAILRSLLRRTECP